MLITSVSICKVHLKKISSTTQTTTTTYIFIYSKTSRHIQDNDLYTHCLPVMPAPSQRIVIWPNWKLNYAIYTSICSELFDILYCSVLCGVVVLVISTLKISQIAEEKRHIHKTLLKHTNRAKKWKRVQDIYLRA